MNRKKLIEEIMNDFQAIRRSSIHKNHHHHHGNLNITPAQGQVIYLVKQKEGIGVTEIADALNISKSATTQLVDALVKNGILIRESSTEDKRALNLKLSDKSKEHLTEMRKQISESITNLLSVFSDEELEVYCKLNKKIAAQIADKKK